MPTGWKCLESEIVQESINKEELKEGDETLKEIKGECEEKKYF